MKKIAIFASGNGSNYEAICQSIGDIITDACVELLVCDNENAYVLKRAQKYKTDTFVFNPKKYNKRSEFEREIVGKLSEKNIDLVVLAGYMRIVGKTLLSKYEGRIINIHPALLPSFKGAHGIKDAFDYGVKVFGVTVHYVSKELDGGKIISQKSFEYYGDNLDEVEKKIHELEYDLYPKTIQKILKEQ